jgi:hypothetical protein
VLPDAGAAVTGRPPAAVPIPTDVRGVVVLVVDGLGRQLLDEHRELAPTLAGAPGVTLDAAFPTTTSTNLTTLGTGRPAGEHGLVGTIVGLPGTTRPLATLTWSWDRQVGGEDARQLVVPEDLQRHPTWFEQQRSIRTTTVLRPEFVGSGLSRAALRGAEVVTAADLDATLGSAVTAASVDGPAVVYAHEGAVDLFGHLDGPASARWRAALRATDDAVGRCVERLSPELALVVTADHGMVEVGLDDAVDLADRPDLLTDVRVLAGDARARQLHVAPGAVDEVTARWSEHVGDRGVVVKREQAVAAGWFGPPQLVEPAVEARIGDVLVLATSPVAWVHGAVDPLRGRLRGHHGALSDAELLVPALVLHNR